MTPLIWASIFLLLAIVLVVVELIIPSGGLISVLSIAAVVCSITLITLEYGTRAGAIYFSITAVAAPILVIYLIRWLPNSSIGEQIMNLPSEADREMETTRGLPKDLIGKVGIARSKMLPSGAIELEGRTYDAVSRGAAIDLGQLVRIVDVDGFRILVQPVAEGMAVQPTEPPPPAKQPLEQILPDPFDDSLA